MALEAGLGAIYKDLERELAKRNGECAECGACCHFSQFKHQLWVTQIELEYLFRNNGQKRPVESGICPYLVDNRCSAREGRTLGCRIFFCKLEPSVAESLYEVYLGRLRSLVVQSGKEIEYGEFLASLRRLAPSEHRS